jgi:hypothetical protein
VEGISVEELEVGGDGTEADLAQELPVGTTSETEGPVSETIEEVQMTSSEASAPAEEKKAVESQQNE